jgi:hypothetical protein
VAPGISGATIFSNDQQRLLISGALILRELASFTPLLPRLVIFLLL